MVTITFSDSFIEQAHKRLREMVEKNLDKISYGEPFTSFYIVRGEQGKPAWIELNIPDDLKEKMGSKKVYIISE